MKIDAVLARHPWPWKLTFLFGRTVDANDNLVIENDTTDAILELVEAHVARTTRVRTHSAECWKWHLDCAVARVEAMKAKEDKQ